MPAQTAEIVVSRFITLRRNVKAPWEARQAIKIWLAASDPVRDDVLQVVSELVTNTCVHVPQGPQRDWLKLRMGFGNGFIRLEVIDPGAPVPEPRFIAGQSQDAEAESGRGLDIVSRLSMRCGTYVTPRGRRVVWCDVETAHSLPDQEPRCLPTSRREVRSVGHPS
ncbi:ATP-binding protein [Nonomuraea guangzhouensis]|uniref:ATP-binding protein n=1 Tax=Nonomuraea guangzhouensis TaxID=1291555 RepID=A0ABW4G9V5_9ACTN